MLISVAELIVVTGPPGAGKPTLTTILSSFFDRSARVDGDAFFRFLDQGSLAPWTLAANQQNETVIRAAAAAAGQLVDGGHTVVYDGVVGPWLFDTFVRASGLRSAHYAILLPPEQLCLDRVQSRVGHGFTDLDATRQMYREFASADIEKRHVITAPRTCSHLRHESQSALQTDQSCAKHSSRHRTVCDGKEHHSSAFVNRRSPQPNFWSTISTAPIPQSAFEPSLRSIGCLNNSRLCTLTARAQEDGPGETSPRVWACPSRLSIENTIGASHA